MYNNLANRALSCPRIKHVVAETGDIFNEFDQLYPSKFNNPTSALNYLSFTHNVPTSAINLTQIYKPYNIRNIPIIDISSDQISVENTMIDSRAFGNPSALKINAKKDIHISGQTDINRFSLMQFNSESVKIDSGFKFNSSLNSNIPIEVLNIKSRGTVDLNGITLGSSLLVDSESSITLNDSKINGNIVRLDAKDKLSVDQGELGITPFLQAQRVSLLGGDIDIGSVGVEAAVDVLVDGARKIEIDGPTRINATLRGVQSITIEAPEVNLNEGTEIGANAMNLMGNTGYIEIDGRKTVSLKGTTIKLNGLQRFYETPAIKVKGGDIVLDNSKLLQFSYYNIDDSHGEKYARQHANLTGSKMTEVNARNTVKFTNTSYIYQNNGDVEIMAMDIDLSDTKIVSLNTWPKSDSPPNLVNLDARKNITLNNTTILGQTLSNYKRMKINLEGDQLESNSTFVGIIDERKGTSGSIDLDFRNSIDLNKTQVASIGLDYLKTKTNGNKINVKSKDLIMKDSVIAGMVQGAGQEGVTKLIVSGEVSLEKSFIGGMLKPLDAIVPNDLITDGTIGDSMNLGNGKIVNIPSSYGEITGKNLYHSFKSFDLSSAQEVVFGMPEGVENVFVRVTGDDMTTLNGEITSSREGGNITLLSEQGFELGPDMEIHDFIGVRIGAVNSIVFDDGNVFNSKVKIDEKFSDAEALYQIKPDQLTGSIKLMGASIKHDNSARAGQSDISLFGDVLDMAASIVTTTDGADINISANSLDMINLSSMDAISPKGRSGGDINLDVNNLSLDQAGMRTVSVGGLGGDVNINANNIKTKDLLMSRIAADNYYLSGGKNYETGDINITAKDTFENERLLVAISSYTPGGAGDLNINAGRFYGDGPDWTASSEIWINAYEGKTGEISINVDTFDAELVRIQNYALSDKNSRLDQGEKAGYGDVTINAKDINFGRFLAYTGTQKTSGLESAADIHINAENNISINEIWLAPIGLTSTTGELRAGVGGNINFKAKNILSAQDALNFDPVYYPTIYNPGQVRFDVEDKLELGVMNFRNGNSSPLREMIYEFKATDIMFGMELGGKDVTKSSVKFDPLNYSSKDHRTIISASGDVRFLSGVELRTPALSLEAPNFNANNSKIQLHATYGSELVVRDTLSLGSGSFIESISGVRPKGGKPVSLDISAGVLEMSHESYIISANHEWFDGGGANPNINLTTRTILMEDGSFISTESTNRDKAGELSVLAHQLSMQKESKIGSYNFSIGETGNVTITANQIEMVDGASIENGFDYAVLDNNNLFPFVSADSGGIQIASEILNLAGGSYIRNAQIDTALSGDVLITSDEIKIAGRSFISTESVPLYQSDFSNRTEVDQNGSVSIKTKSLDLSDSSYVKTTTVIPKRNAGDITIEADAVSLSGRSSMVSNTEPNKFETELGLTGLDYGNAGRLEIKTGSLQLADQSKISSDSFTSGDGGDVNLTAADLALANRSAIYAGALGQGEGGRITIDTIAMSLSGKSAVVADVRDTGNGGEVSVKADSLEMDESLIYGSTSGTGSGSRISVKADSILLQNGARIESAASSEGAAGALDVISGTIAISGVGEGFDPKDIEGGETGETVASGLLTSTVGSGAAGTIELKADHLEMKQGLIGSASTGAGAAGSVGLSLSKGLSLDQGARVSVSSSQADGGDIEVVSAGDVSLARSELTASAAKDGGSIRLLGAGHTYIRGSRLSAEAGQDGGNITIHKPELLFMNRGQLSANAVYGEGGYIQVAAEAFLPSIDTAITASSEYGVQGVVEIDTMETDIGSGLVVLPEQLEDRSVNLAERCALRLQGDVSSFFINGQGGVPVWSKDIYLPTVIVPELDNTDRPSDQDDAQ